MSLVRKITKSFNKACVDYSLLEDDDKILVGLSGGKDSLMLLYLLAQRSRIYRPSINVEAAHVIMDNIPYEADTTFIEEFCSTLGVPLHMLHASFEDADNSKSKCFLCSWNRRKTLFKFAECNGFNKIALGHHQDDILTTLLMNMSFEGNVMTMSPLMKMKHYPLTIIRPLCLIIEEDIQTYAISQSWSEMKMKCPYENQTMRKHVNDILNNLLTLSPEVRFNLWNACLRLGGELPY